MDIGKRQYRGANGDLYSTCRSCNSNTLVFILELTLYSTMFWPIGGTIQQPHLTVAFHYHADYNLRNLVLVTRVLSESQSL